MSDYNWVVEILIAYINGPEFQGETSGYLKNQTILYFDPSGNSTTKKNLFNEYHTHFDKTLGDFFSSNGLKKEHFEHTIDLILSSEEGLEDTRLSSNLLAAREYSIYDMLMNYYYALSLYEEAIAQKEADHIFLDELLGNSELAEINLAIAVSDCIKSNVESKKAKKAPAQSLPSKPAKAPASSAPASSADSSLFKLTGPSVGSAPAGGQLTALSVDAVNAKKDKLQAIESELTQKIAKLREEQEKKIRSMAPELASSIIAKRKKALAVQASSHPAGKKTATSQPLGKNVGSVPAKKK